MAAQFSLTKLADAAGLASRTTSAAALAVATAASAVAAVATASAIACLSSALASPCVSLEVDAFLNVHLLFSLLCQANTSLRNRDIKQKIERVKEGTFSSWSSLEGDLKARLTAVSQELAPLLFLMDNGKAFTGKFRQVCVEL